MFKFRNLCAFSSKLFGDTLEKTCDTRMCHDTLLEKHCNTERKKRERERERGYSKKEWGEKNGTLIVLLALK